MFKLLGRFSFVPVSLGLDCYGTNLWAAFFGFVASMTEIVTVHEHLLSWCR